MFYAVNVVLIYILNKSKDVRVTIVFFLNGDHYLLLFIQQHLRQTINHPVDWELISNKLKYCRCFLVEKSRKRRQNYESILEFGVKNVKKTARNV